MTLEKKENGAEEKISIIIPTMNRPDSLNDVLEAISKSFLQVDEILLVDQSAKEEMREKNKKLLKKYQLPIHYFCISPPSLTKARNFGFEKASHEIIIMMDDDAIIERDTIQNITNIMADASVSMIAGLDINAGEDKSVFGYLFGKKSFSRRREGYITNAMYSRLPQKTLCRVETEWAMGYFFVIKKSIAEKYNVRWDEKFIGYGYPEDMDFSYRYYIAAQKEGLKCIADPSVKVRHMVSKEWRETSKAVTLMTIINREYLTYKWGKGIGSRIATRWANFGLFIQRMLQKDRCMDVLLAQYYCDKYRKDIKNGNLHTELYS